MNEAAVFGANVDEFWMVFKGECDLLARGCRVESLRGGGCAFGTGTGCV
jgi:hypothetical protein